LVDLMAAFCIAVGTSMAAIIKDMLQSISTTLAAVP